MYNGIGLTTARGSGTSGYVQTNKFHRDASRLTRDGHDGGSKRSRDAEGSRGQPVKRRGMSDAILAHNAKREIEVRVAELAERLEEDPTLSEEDRRVKTDALRRELEVKLDERRRSEAAMKRASAAMETHAREARKDAEMDKLARAFGVNRREADAREGDAFDRDLQRRLKEEKREAREEEQRKREKERRKAEKRAKKEKKREKKEKRMRERAERRERERAEKNRRRGEDARRNVERLEG